MESPEELDPQEEVLHDPHPSHEPGDDNQICYRWNRGVEEFDEITNLGRLIEAVDREFPGVPYSKISLWFYDPYVDICVRGPKP